MGIIEILLMDNELIAINKKNIIYCSIIEQGKDLEDGQAMLKIHMLDCTTSLKGNKDRIKDAYRLIVNSMCNDNSEFIDLS